MARSGEKYENRRNINQYWRPKRTKTDSLRPTEAILSSKRLGFWRCVPGANESFENPHKIRAFETPKSDLSKLSAPQSIVI